MMSRRRCTLRAGSHTLALGERTLVMGIVNVTPDSFSDGGAFFDPAAAVEHGLRLAAEGADILDVGGESTRPGAAPVPAEEELRRVVPVVRGLGARGALPMSVDTTKAAVARAALDAGASIVNDFSALRFDPALGPAVAAAGAALVLMHMRGEPRTMQQAPRSDDLLGEVRAELEFKAQMVELDGDIIFWRFGDDQPAVTTRLDKGVIVVEEGENPASQIGMKLKAKVLLDVIDNSLEAKMMYTHTELVKGDIELARHHVFALVPYIYGMQDYYDSDASFKKMVLDKKQGVRA